jgi:hypothetical protein
MTTPWIEIVQYQDQEGSAGPGFADYLWQAAFACQVGILPHQEWVKLKWGFNALALFDEALERQRLFLESQHAIWNDLSTEMPDHRTLTYRFVARPGNGLLVAILCKIHGRTEAEAQAKALAFCRELQATFPYDYVLMPAVDQEGYNRLRGTDIFDGALSASNLAQIKRVEVPLNARHSSPALQGLWQSAPHGHEQIWRALAGSPSPLLLNISLRSTVLYGKERERLLDCAEEIAKATSENSHNPKTLATLKQWNTTFIERRLNLWEKFFYLQVHLISPEDLDESIARIVGASLTLSKDGRPLPGYQVISPKFGEEVPWLQKLKNQDIIFSGSALPVPRLSEVADLEEVIAAMRIPYSPPENGFPNLRFAPGSTVQE